MTPGELIDSVQDEVLDRILREFIDAIASIPEGTELYSFLIYKKNPDSWETILGEPTHPDGSYCIQFEEGIHEENQKVVAYADTIWETALAFTKALTLQLWETLCRAYGHAGASGHPELLNDAWEDDVLRSWMDYDFWDYLDQIEMDARSSVTPSSRSSFYREFLENAAENVEMNFHYAIELSA